MKSLTIEFEKCEVCFREVERTPTKQTVKQLSEIFEKALGEKFIRAYYTNDSIVATS